MSDLRARYTAYLIETGAFEEISERPTAASEIVLHDGEYMWAEPIDKDCKIGRLNSWMFHVAGRGWFIPTGTIVGRVPADVVDAAHAEALAIEKLSANMRKVYEGIAAAGKGGFPSGGNGRALRGLLSRGLIRYEIFEDTYRGPGPNNGTKFTNARYFLNF